MSLLQKHKVINHHESCLSQCMKIVYLVQRHKIIRKVASLGVRKLCKSQVRQERKLCILTCVKQKIVYIENDVICLYYKKK